MARVALPSRADGRTAITQQSALGAGAPLSDGVPAACPDGRRSHGDVRAVHDRRGSEGDEVLRRLDVSTVICRNALPRMGSLRSALSTPRRLAHSIWSWQILAGEPVNHPARTPCNTAQRGWMCKSPRPCRSSTPASPTRRTPPPSSPQRCEAIPARRGSRSFPARGAGAPDGSRRARAAPTPVPSSSHAVQKATTSPPSVTATRSRSGGGEARRLDLPAASALRRRLRHPRGAWRRSAG